jgi:hypothetical protein
MPIVISRSDTPPSTAEQLPVEKSIDTSLNNEHPVVAIISTDEQKIDEKQPNDDADETNTTTDTIILKQPSACMPMSFSID